MNVLFHTTSAIAIAVLVTNTKKIEHDKTNKSIYLTSLVAFIVGIISHGALDYIPHCYPINSKVDVFASLCLFLFLLFITNRKYRFILSASFIGCIFPDIVDLSPGIINHHVGIYVPTFKKIFPWHWHEYSGSIYHGSCYVSSFNHLLLFFTVLIICIIKWHEIKIITKKRLG